MDGQGKASRWCPTQDIREDFERMGEELVIAKAPSYQDAENIFTAMDWLREKRLERERREMLRFRKMLFVTIVAAVAAVVGAVAAIWAGAVAKGWM